MTILVTGGLGYIGSHTVVELANSGNEVVIVDNLSNSKIEVLDRLKEITNKDIEFIEADVRDILSMSTIMDELNIDSVIHFAGLKSVRESEETPIRYYVNNVTGLITLLRAMERNNVKNIIFSSSACVYGMSSNSGISESSDTSPYNVYGRTKLMCEEILKDCCRSDKNFNAICLRYFNPIGAHSSGLIGEDPLGIPNNLMPIICRVASGRTSKLTIFGDDYNTEDGTCERDYIHVVDLAKGHIKALDKIGSMTENYKIYNLGSGVPHSVKEIVDAFSKVNSIDVPYEIGERRSGDIDKYFANPSLANRELGWKTHLSLEDMCRDSWNFYKKEVV